ncbi:MAG TPA: hydroxymethylglutaryl-CoA lyase [Planctomycetota bacterium]|nr:hydroxymethylglutaryl-CoA lyase [Planctomycetota bacterium]
MTTSTTVRLVETVRDAWQGLPRVLPTESKVSFVQRLLDAGFRRVDVGSFVSPSRVPSMADTGELLARLRVPAAATLTALVASESGLERLLAVSAAGAGAAAGSADGVSGGAPVVREVLYPFSLSERFQRRNTERSREEAFATLQAVVARAHEARRTVYTTISMAFGNNEGDAFDSAELRDWVARLHGAGVDRVGLADTTAMADAAAIARVYGAVMREARWAVPSAHLHVTPENQRALLDAALDAGVRDIDCALGGLGGCQFAKGAVSNVSTLPLVRHLLERGLQPDLPAQAVAALPELDLAARTLAAGSAAPATG